VGKEQALSNPFQFMNHPTVHDRVVTKLTKQELQMAHEVMQGIQLAQFRGEWSDFVNTVLKFSVL
jgi:hypothetical protein